MSLGLVTGLLGAIAMARDISRSPGESHPLVGGSLYEIGARTKQTSRDSSETSNVKYMRGAAFMSSAAKIGISFAQMGVMLRKLGFTKEELRGSYKYFKNSLG